MALVKTEKILILDTQQSIQSKIEATLMKLGYRATFLVSDYSTATSLLHHIRFDLIILKLNQGEKRKMMIFLEFIKSKKVSTIYLFDNGGLEHYGIQFEALHTPLAMLKIPFDPLNLRATLEIYFGQLRAALKDNSLKIDKKGEEQYIYFKDIKWVHSRGNNCHIYTTTEVIELRYPLHRLIEKLPVRTFLQIHRSYVIQMSYLDQLNLKDKAVSVEGVSLPIGRKYKSALFERLNII